MHRGHTHTHTHIYIYTGVRSEGARGIAALTSALARPSVCVIGDELIDRPIFVATIGEEAPNGERDLPLSELLLGYFKWVRFVCHLDHDGRVHAVYIHT